MKRVMVINFNDCSVYAIDLDKMRELVARNICATGDIEYRQAMNIANSMSDQELTTEAGKLPFEMVQTHLDKVERGWGTYFRQLQWQGAQKTIISRARFEDFLLERQKIQTQPT